MKKPDTIVDDIHATRRKIDARIQGMTVSERTAYFNQAGEEIARQYGLKRVTSMAEHNTPMCQPDNHVVADL